MTASSFDKLDKSIQKVVTKMRKLQRENERLEAKAAKLEERLQAAPDAKDAVAWDKERETIKGRVEELVQTLETALAEE